MRPAREVGLIPGIGYPLMVNGVAVVTAAAVAGTGVRAWPSRPAGGSWAGG